MYELIEGDFESFFRVPFSCYGSGSLYVSPLRSDLKRFLDRKANPLFARYGDFTYFTVHRAGEPVGRLVTHVHHASNRRHGLQRSYFGFFDCADDSTAAKMLLDAAEAWGRAQGCEEIAGNFNLTAMQQIGVVTEGFENPPYTDQVYNPPHIPRLLAACGYAPTFPMSTFELDLRGVDSDALLNDRTRALIADTDLRWERLRMRGFARLMDDTRAVLNDGFAENPMFVPLTREEFMFQAREMIWIIDQRIAPIVYHREQPIGVVVCIPDLNPLLRAIGSRVRWSAPYHYLRYWFKRRRAVIIFYAVVRAFHGRGLNSAILAWLMRALQQAGYSRLGVTWIADVNLASLRQMQKLGARRLHRTHLFHKNLRRQ